MIGRILPTENDQKAISEIHVDAATQVNDFYDYSKVIVRKPWGYEYLMFENKHVAIWILFLKKGFQTSLHCHKFKKTSLMVLSGEAVCRGLHGENRLGPGEGLIIAPSTFHSTESVSDGGLFVMEIETPVNKRDLLRLKDKYGRQGQGYEGEEHRTRNIHNYNYMTFGPSQAYYEATKKFGHCSLTLSRPADAADVTKILRSGRTDAVAVLAGQVTAADGRVLADVGDTVDAESLHQVGLSATPGLELLLIKRRDSMVRLSDYVISFLERRGVQTIYLVAGQASTHLLDAVGRNTQVGYVSTHHEQAATLAAQGEARLAGRPGVCLVSAGASSAAALAGVASAWADSTPLLVLSGQCKAGEMAQDGLRQLGINELPTARIVEPVTKYAATVTNPAEIRLILEKAWHMATTGRPGPAWVDLPFDVQGRMVDEDELARYEPEERSGATGGDGIVKDAVAKTLRMLREAQRPVLLVGRGVRLADALPELLDLLARTALPVVTSLNGKDLVPADHPALVGVMGAYGHRAANFAVQNSDLLVSIGSRLSIAEVGCRYEEFARAARKVVVDIDAAELAKPTLTPDLPVKADAKAFLHELLRQMTEPVRAKADWTARCAAWRHRFPQVEAPAPHNPSSVDVRLFYQALSRAAKPGAVFAVDRGTSFYAAMQALAIKPDQRLLAAAGLMTPGFAIPAALGAAMFGGRKDVYAVCGDGSFQLTLAELNTLVHYKVPIRVFVLDNAGHATIRKTQGAYFRGREVGTDPSSGKGFLDPVKAAEIFGLPSYVIENHAEMEKRLPEILERPGPFVCVLRLDPKYQIEPRLVSSVKPDGTLVSKPLEDMFPFLSREDLKSNMVIDVVPED